MLPLGSITMFIIPLFVANTMVRWFGSLTFMLDRGKRAL